MGRPEADGSTDGSTTAVGIGVAVGCCVADEPGSLAGADSLTLGSEVTVGDGLCRPTPPSAFSAMKATAPTPTETTLAMVRNTSRYRTPV